MNTRAFSFYAFRLCSRAPLALAISIAALLPALPASADDVTKADNTIDLGTGTSWVTNVVPTAADVAVWQGVYNTAGSLSAVLPTTALSWQGIRIGNITGTAAGLVSIGGTGAAVAGSSLTIGTAGIDLSAANQNLVINAATIAVTGAAQTWSVAAGRNVRLGTTGTGSANANFDGTGNTVISVTGGGVVDLNEGGALGFADAAGFAGFNGKWIIGTSTTVRAIRNGGTAFGTSTATDAITLSGGTLAVGGISGTQGNWTWNTPMTLAAATSSSLDQQLFSGNGRYLKLMGVMTGSGNLTFKETGANDAFTSDDLGFIVTGTNTMSGTVTIGGATENGITGRLSSVRLGGNTGATDVTTTAGLTGDLGTATVVNNGVLTLSHSNTWTFSNAVSGTGALRIGGAVSGAATQNVTLAGADTYTGATTVSTGTLVVSGSISGTVGVTVNNNGTLLLGNSDVINNAATVTLSGGKLDTGGFSEGKAAQADGLGNLTLTASSNLDFSAAAAGGSQLWFAGLGTHTSGAFLAITNWNGTPYAEGGAGDDRLIFAGTDPNVFRNLYAQSDVSFNGVAGYAALSFGDGSHYEIVAIPEPSAALLSAPLLALLGYRERRRLRALCR